MPKPDALTSKELTQLGTLLRRLGEAIAKVSTDLEAMRLRLEVLEQRVAQSPTVEG